VITIAQPFPSLNHRQHGRSRRREARIGRMRAKLKSFDFAPDLAERLMRITVPSWSVVGPAAMSRW
jgi:hypothetical protein